MAVILRRLPATDLRKAVTSSAKPLRRWKRLALFEPGRRSGVTTRVHVAAAKSTNIAAGRTRGGVFRIGAELVLHPRWRPAEIVIA